jgi:hypothetical protein
VVVSGLSNGLMISLDLGSEAIGHDSKKEEGFRF